MEVEVRIEGGAEAVEEGDGAELRVGRGAGAGATEGGANGAQQDAEHVAGQARVVGQEESDPLRQGEHPLAREKQRLRALMLLGAAAGLITLAAPSAVWERIQAMKNLTSEETLGDADSSAEQRWVIWKVARAVISDHPLGGVGYGAYPKANADHARSNPAWNNARESAKRTGCISISWPRPAMSDSLFSCSSWSARFACPFRHSGCCVRTARMRPGSYNC